jgi:hypothetical protein
MQLRHPAKSLIPKRDRIIICDDAQADYHDMVACDRESPVIYVVQIAS